MSLSKACSMIGSPDDQAIAPFEYRFLGQGFKSKLSRCLQIKDVGGSSHSCRVAQIDMMCNQALECHANREGVVGVVGVLLAVYELVDS